MRHTPNSETEIIIDSKAIYKGYFRSLIWLRELIFFLAWKDIIVRYRQAVLGVLWSVFTPVFTMIVFVFIFGKIAGLPSNGIPYPLLVFAALLPWQFFSSSVFSVGNSIVSYSGMISKIFFPRLVLPLSALVLALVDFVIAVVILAVLMIIYGFYPSWQLIFAPLFILLMVLLAFSTGLILSALNVKYRDVKFVVPFLLQLGLYVSPIGFSTSVIPKDWAFLYAINPMVGVINGFRWCLLGGKLGLDLGSVLISIIFTIVFLAIGMWYFRKTEKTFADII